MAAPNFLPEEVTASLFAPRANQAHESLALRLYVGGIPKSNHRESVMISR